MIALYCPNLPPIPGGLADQTLLLARALERRGAKIAVLARRGDPKLLAPIPVRLDVEPATLSNHVGALGMRSLLVQYVPFLYARFGVAPSLCRALGRIRQRGVRIALFVHEPYVPFTRLPWLVTGPLQRLQLRCLVRTADRVYAAVPRFAEIARRYARDPHAVSLAPVGANFSTSSLTKDAARAALGIADGTTAIGVFSPAAAGYHLAWVRAAMDALRARGDITWIVFGSGSDQCFPAPPGNVRALGRLGAQQVSDTARGLDLFVAPFTDGLTMRRSSAMLGLASGLPVVSSTGELFDPSLAQYAACEPSEAAFVARVRSLVDGPAERASLAARAQGSAAVTSVDTLAGMLQRDLGE